ncbi:MAG: hypothetical protein CMK92_02335 [Pseudomonas sp.]|nr:hypothetical protein [Pseudomonas sp.]
MLYAILDNGEYVFSRGRSGALYNAFYVSDATGEEFSSIHDINVPGSYHAHLDAEQRTHGKSSGSLKSTGRDDSVKFTVGGGKKARTVAVTVPKKLSVVAPVPLTSSSKPVMAGGRKWYATSQPALMASFLRVDVYRTSGADIRKGKTVVHRAGIVDRDEPSNDDRLRFARRTPVRYVPNKSRKSVRRKGPRRFSGHTGQERGARKGGGCHNNDVLRVPNGKRMLRPSSATAKKAWMDMRRHLSSDATRVNPFAALLRYMPDKPTKFTGAADGVQGLASIIVVEFFARVIGDYCAASSQNIFMIDTKSVKHTKDMYKGYVADMKREISSCKNRFYVMPVQVTYNDDEGDSQHRTSIVIDTTKKRYYYFDSEGESDDYDDVVDMLRKTYAKDVLKGYRYVEMGSSYCAPQRQGVGEAQCTNFAAIFLIAFMISGDDDPSRVAEMFGKLPSSKVKKYLARFDALVRSIAGRVVTPDDYFNARCWIDALDA